MYKKALQIAFNAHKGQLRKQSCVPYIVHPIRVANCFNDDVKKTIAILHDVVEDTKITLKDLEKYFPDCITIRVDILTRKIGENHFDYIERVKKDEVATEIKIADIVDNLSDTLCVCEKSMVKRYEKSLSILLK